MFKKKQKVRDKRFKNREVRPSEPAQPRSVGSNPSPRGESSSPKRGGAPSQRASSPRPDDDDDRPAAKTGLGPASKYSNLLIPGLLVLAVGIALWVKFSPADAPVAAGADGGTESQDGGRVVAVDGSSATDASTPRDVARAVLSTDAASLGDVAVADAGAEPMGNGDEVVPAHPEPTSPDPRHGAFSIADAAAGLPGSGGLVAEIETSMGTFTCDLLSHEAPNTVANFVGLARGTRDFWDPTAGRWARRPFYDGSIFHRVIPDFMIQGGDQLRSGTGGTGYDFADENVNGHNAAGQLCMANHGPGTNGSQFFITEVAKPHLDGSYSIFGQCRPADLVVRIARVPAVESRPVTPVFIRHVRIRHA